MSGVEQLHDTGWRNIDHNEIGWHVPLRTYLFLPQCIILIAKAVTQVTVRQPDLDGKGKFSVNFATFLHL